MFNVPRQYRTFAAVISVLVIAIAVILIQKHFSRPRTPLERSAALGRTVGDVLAAEVGKLLDGKGAVAIIEVDRAGSPLSPLTHIQTHFESELRRNGNIKIVATVLGNKEDMVGSSSDWFGISGKGFSQLLAEHPDADLIVSFAGPPEMSPAQLRDASNKLPKCVVVQAWGVPGPWIKPLVKAGLVQLAMVPITKTVPDMGGRLRTALEWYEMFFTSVTPQSVDLIPD